MKTTNRPQIQGLSYQYLELRKKYIEYDVGTYEANQAREQLITVSFYLSDAVAFALKYNRDAIEAEK